ncbi:MAG: hypothetical protein K2X81_01250 [Candidatus Obscuribacterales bacterium]|nr:hypothetical protein [Candidatus Obscuribacterales bacterium]
MSFIFQFNWSSLQQLREATTIYLSARLYAMAQRVQQAVSESGCPKLKTIMASNPETPAELLDFLTIVGSTSVVIRVAENPNTSKETLSKLAFHNDAEVRAAVAENTNASESCFKRLANDMSADVRFRLAENPHAPAAVLYNLLRDENPYVSARARKTLSRILYNTITESTRMMAEETELRPELISQSSNKQLNRQLMENLHTSTGCDVFTMEFSRPEATA